MARYYGNQLTRAVAQAGRSVTENADGSMEGVVNWIIDAGSVSPKEASALTSELLPKVSGSCSQCSPGDDHPDDPRLECYERSVNYGPNNIIECTASYFGLWEPSKRIIDYKGSVTALPVTRHPKWDEIALDAVLDPIGLFIGFSEFISTKTSGEYENLYGAREYLAAGTSITLSYWLETQPIAKKIGVIYQPSEGDGIPALPGVVDYLIVNQSYRQIGNFYQVSEEYLGSGAEGWNKIIYQGQEE